MRAANLETSERLQRVAALLADGREYTTRTIIRKARVCAVNTAIAELRENGLDIRCRKKGRRFYYRRVTDEQD